MQNLLMLLLFTGISPLVLSLSRKYYLIKQTKTWSEARAYCQATHDDLATIESADDMLQLESVAQRHLFNDKAWIGVYSEVKSWRWSYENVSLGPFTAWHVDEPEKDGIEECTMTDDAKWHDEECVKKFKFACFDEMATNSFQYIKVNQEMTWHDAQSYCRNHHKDLASVQDLNENNALHNVVGSDKIWIGLFRDSWKWVDQTNTSSIEWKTGQPENKDGACGFIHGREVEVGQCSLLLNFFCYSVITGQKQTVRFKIQSEQDMNDPKVQAAILEKIKDKLKEFPVAENATVLWKALPDGKPCGQV